jgi:hypothetical protein
VTGADFAVCGHFTLAVQGRLLILSPAEKPAKMRVFFNSQNFSRFSADNYCTLPNKCYNDDMASDRRKPTNTEKPR